MTNNFEMQPIHSGHGLVTVFWEEPHPEKVGQVEDAHESINGDFSIYPDGTVKIIDDEKVTVYSGAFIKKVEAPKWVSAYAEGSYTEI